MHHVCFCLTDSSGVYYKHALVAMASIFLNTKSALCIHILSDETLTEEKRVVFRECCANYGQEIAFYDVPNIAQHIIDNIPGYFGKGSLYRLFIADLLPVDTVLYLDCDVIFNTDIKDVFSHDISAHFLGAVHDFGMQSTKKKRKYLQGLGITPEKYMNTGVLLMNLKKIRLEHSNFGEQIFSIIDREKLRYQDQDAINKYFAKGNNEVLVIPEKYNFCLGLSDRVYLEFSDYNGKVLHFNSDEKPWEVFSQAGIFYWKYYATIFSAEETFSSIETLHNPYNFRLYRFILQNSQVRRMVNRIYQIKNKGLSQTLRERIFPSRKK